MSEPITTWKDLDKTFTEIGNAYTRKLAQDALIPNPFSHLVAPPTPAELRRARRRNRLHRLRLLWLALAHPEELEER